MTNFSDLWPSILISCCSSPVEGGTEKANRAVDKQVFCNMKSSTGVNILKSTPHVCQLSDFLPQKEQLAERR